MREIIDEKIKEMAKLVIENQDTLVAKFILENPNLKAEEIELVQENHPFKFVFHVRKKTSAGVFDLEKFIKELKFKLEATRLTRFTTILRNDPKTILGLGKLEGKEELLAELIAELETKNVG